MSLHLRLAINNITKPLQTAFNKYVITKIVLGCVPKDRYRDQHGTDVSDGYGSLQR